ncbi:ribonuclease activity regulator RraA [Streptomyces sp. NBC_00687]|uniref:ribonuclease activity regulator RraA n=1 Tax=Streptomyces sp. NBC_00687 TaxID=2975807 RepID=UPI00224E4718|nr:ribonuclease activity regulator RraA [Streptomyces sp. NBC_00687]MCX4918913.1 ribonuclease activity regulator RraA [Streptomyces sp. NBC_00687]
MTGTPQAPLDPDDLAALSEASTATITTQLFKHGLRNTFLAGLTRVSENAPRMIGEAFTLRYIPAREDIDVLEVYDDYDHPQRAAVEQVGPGQILVVDCRGEGRAASAGNILLTRLSVRGAAGLVTDGTLRDIGEISRLPLPVYATGAAAMTNLALHHAVDLQVPIGCAGVAIYPGDVLVGDADGVVCIPRHLVATIARQAQAQEQLETFITERITAGAPLRGTYPADAATLRAYEEGRLTQAVRD